MPGAWTPERRKKFSATMKAIKARGKNSSNGDMAQGIHSVTMKKLTGEYDESLIAKLIDTFWSKLNNNQKLEIAIEHTYNKK